jgi:hypothetical protein
VLPLLLLQILTARRKHDESDTEAGGQSSGWSTSGTSD